MNFDFVTDRLAIGATPETVFDLLALIEVGITAIINCRDDLDIYMLIANHPLQYLWNGTEDWIPLATQHKGLSWFQQGVEFALPLLAQPKHKIYCFCVLGANRSATMAWTILRALGFTTAECFAAIDTHRLIDIPGLIECGWWKDAEVALKSLSYI